MSSLPTARQQCESHGHIWVTVVAGLDRCSLCGAEIFDLDAKPITVESQPTPVERECPDCDGRGWNEVIGHEPGCCDGNGCGCSGVQEQEPCGSCGGTGVLNG